MGADHVAAPDGVMSSRAEPSVALGSMREICERHADELSALTETLAVFRRGAHSLSVQNAELRSQIELMRAMVHTRCPMPHAQVWEMELPVDDTSVQASRAAVADVLSDRVPHGVLKRAQLIVAEMLADGPSQRNQDAPQPLVLRIESSPTTIKVELDDPSRTDALAFVQDTGGIGLYVIEQLSERWGGERLDTGGMRIWAQLTLLLPT